MKYKVNFKDIKYDEYTYYDVNNKEAYIMVYLSGDSEDQFKNLIFKENETKFFNLNIYIHITIDTDDGDMIDGSYWFDPIEYFITVKNGQFDLQVESFDVEPEWEIELSGDYSYETKADFLNNKLKEESNNINLNAIAIQKFLKNKIIIEPIED